MINRSMPPSVVIPVLAYHDVREAVAWLCRSFGFVERLRIGNHRAQLSFDEGAVVAEMRHDPDASSPEASNSRPLSVGWSSHSVMVRVADIDKHYERAKRSGARIVSPPTDYPYGERLGYRGRTVLTENDVIIRVNPPLTADDLFAFYERNNICEVGFGKETAAKVLQHTRLIVAAYADGELVGLARATFDGLSAHVMEFSLDLRLQGGDPRYENGSLIEADNSGVGRRLGERLLNELEAMGASFITCYIVANCEELFYQSLGFRENEGHLVYYIDKRPYVQG